jgi:AraC family transcriptional regulator
MKDSSKSYQWRFSKVFAYIEKHLSEPLTLDELCKVSHFSKFHFHRQFSLFAGLSVFRYIQVMRLKRAAFQLTYRPKMKIVDIAVQAAFENASSFTRAFKHAFSQSPSQFRKAPNWEGLIDINDMLTQKKENFIKKIDKNTDVGVIKFNPTKVAVLEHHGSSNLLSNSIKKFIEWRIKKGVTPPESKTYNIIYNDPEVVPENEFRFDLCASVKKDIDDNDYGIITKVIPGGYCAVLRHIGSDENLSQSIQTIYQWALDREEELRDFPCFLHRVTLFPDVSESEMITDIYLLLTNEN